MAEQERATNLVEDDVHGGRNNLLIAFFLVCFYLSLFFFSSFVLMNSLMMVVMVTAAMHNIYLFSLYSFSFFGFSFSLCFFFVRCFLSLNEFFIVDYEKSNMTKTIRKKIHVKPRNFSKNKNKNKNTTSLVYKEIVKNQEA